ncbi:hypothetical protein LCGC14_2476540 [marine sediment metagenome]|uniref:Aminoglycoside phosphotransferase domain-containing protein n=1 Tax=marine sediment metagenome TaxID=412755 RepID=A0A0F9BWS2_9ZZZZ
MIKGHSNCKIEVVNGNIRKSAKYDEYDLVRFQEQINKHRNFAKKYNNKKDCPIYIPKILEEGHYCIIEQEPHEDILQFLSYSNEHKIDILIKQILYFIADIVKESSTTKRSIPTIKSKFEKVKLLLKNKNKFTNRQIQKLDDQFGLLFRYVHNIEIPVGQAHCDLTLSNILIHPSHEKIMLIDCLEKSTFIQSPFIDMVKLRQDTKHKWVYFLDGQKYDKNTIYEKLDYMDKILVKEFKDKYGRWYQQSYYELLQFINLIRIIPYSKNQETTNFILKELQCL